ncbi:rhomboid-related protein 1 isoform X1 [Cervus elaphus]|uniref:rhomboid-related protein 1 isoform X1 n=1 Tax=Cervus canadensis TaxID=1574408 RepID=UPI0018BA3043|nr:rhomboid-related protein 1 isoform X1 [Cervus canadensis]XP_043771689.1 rhomboid-related protein 1 isoform X1 [Cervus elaphus]
MGTGSRAPFLPGHVLVRGARVSRPRVAGRASAACAAGAGGSVTRRRAERAEPEGRGGAESSAEQPLPAAAVDPGPGPRPGSMDRSSLLQLIQEQQLDPENTGFIGADTFTGLVHRHELPLDPAKLDMLVALAQSNERGQVCYQELVDLISSKRSSSFKRAIANGQRALPRDGLLDEPGLGVYKRFVRYVAYEILPREVDRHWYFYRHRSCPPPVFMASVTLAQIIVFLCYGARLNKWVLQTYHPEYMKSPLVYHPGHRARAWRFLTYMFMHVGLEQLGFNALLQLMIGVPLEMVHGLLRISLLYLAGVLAELGWDEVSLQAAEDGAGPGVHELRGGPGRMAALLPATACLRPTAQLHGAPGGRGGGRQHGPDHPAQLRRAPAGPVRLVGGAACLWHLPAVCHLLEHLRLRPVGCPYPPTTLTGSQRPGCRTPGPATRRACMSTLSECSLEAAPSRCGLVAPVAH